MLKGIKVTLVNLVEIGKDEFNRPIYKENKKQVENVLVSPSSMDDVVNQTNLYGKKAIYTLAIPKGDNNVWENQYVEFFGKRWHIFTPEVQGIDHLIPLNWNKKVMVEAYNV